MGNYEVLVWKCSSLLFTNFKSFPCQDDTERFGFLPKQYKRGYRTVEKERVTGWNFVLLPIQYWSERLSDVRTVRMSSCLVFLPIRGSLAAKKVQVVAICRTVT